MKLLVVEDNSTAAAAIQSLLLKLGFEVDIVDDGYDGAEKARNNDYGLIFMDIGLPTLSGVEATRKIRSYKIDTPIIALTATLSDLGKLEAFGFNGGYEKPLSFERLLEIIEKFHLTP